MSTARVFDRPHYDSLNASRGAAVKTLLSELRPCLGLESAVDVGCGLGHFSGLLHSFGFSVVAVDGREQNVQEAQRRFPIIPFHRYDAQDPALRELGSFDLVFCFGLLYHLENPFATVRHLRAMTSKLLLIEAVIYPGEDPIMGLVDEGAVEDQGLNYVAFYPTEACLVKMLYRAGFQQVYGLVSPPDHPEYHLAPGTRRTRTVLAASLSPIASNQLRLLEEKASPVIPWDPRIVAPEGTGAGRRLVRLATRLISGG